jgi:hypothetical protein
MKEGCPPNTYKTDHKCKKFYDTNCMSARDKYFVYIKYRSFLDSLKKEYNKITKNMGNSTPTPLLKFHNELYEHLHQHCGFIAHYDRHGFYHTYFDEPDATIDFIEHMKEAEKRCHEDYSDINEAMAKETKKVSSDLIRLMEMRCKKRDIETAKNLLDKYGLKIKGLK